jgi:signal transduction histidine kinase
VKRPSSLPVLVQVAALAATAVIATQAVTFAVLLISPDPRPAGFSVTSAAEALRGRAAETTDGRALKRRLSDRPVAEPGDRDPMERVIAAVLAEQLGAAQGDVRVAVAHPPVDGAGWRRPFGGGENRVDVSLRPPPHRIVLEQAIREEDAVVRGTSSIVTMIRPKGATGAPVEILRPATPNVQAFSILSDRLSFAPFTASLRLSDGRWATVEPPRAWLSPWQQRVLLALLISAVLLAPLVWWMARRLTQPIRVFAQAAERLGADPEAAPLPPSGPAEVRTAITAFNDMQASLRTHIRHRTQTIAAIAHDLRTPLTRLRFRAEQAPDSVRDRMAADIEEMDGLIAQAMAFVRGEQATERRERFDLDALVADCAGGFAETGAPAAFDGGAPLWVQGDPAALRRAVGNLVDNAIKFGGAARVRSFAQDGRAVVSVEDDGPGLAEDELEAAFQPFHRGERSRNRETGGVGLGLAVARQAARSAGGEVVLINRPGGGLEARLTLPLA